jgi:hypothetical protein
MIRYVSKIPFFILSGYIFHHTVSICELNFICDLVCGLGGYVGTQLLGCKDGSDTRVFYRYIRQLEYTSIQYRPGWFVGGKIP